MKAVRLVEYNSLPKVQEIPKPEIIHPSDVIVKIGGAGVCRTDLHIMEGQFREIFTSTKLPFTLGHENAGWIEEVGSGVKSFKAGDPVVIYFPVTCGLCPNCRYGRDMYCTDSRSIGLDGLDGGFAEFVKASVRNLIKVPRETNIQEIAPLADAGITVYHAFKKVIPLLYPGTFVVVFGVGGLGHLGIQLLKKLTSSTIIALDLSEDRLKLAREFGAEYTMVSDPTIAPQEVKKICGGLGADVVMDFVGDGNTPSQAINMIRRGGAYSVVGYGGPLNTTTHAIITRELNIIGNLVGTYNDLRELIALYKLGGIKVLTTPFALEDAPRALEMLKAGSIMGRGVLVP